MACECERCPECRGSGRTWRSFDGKYLGESRCDDLDEMEPCEECRGRGVTEVCWECQQAYEEEMEDY